MAESERKKYTKGILILLSIVIAWVALRYCTQLLPKPASFSRSAKRETYLSAWKVATGVYIECYKSNALQETFPFSYYVTDSLHYWYAIGSCGDEALFSYRVQNDSLIVEVGTSINTQDSTMRRLYKIHDSVPRQEHYWRLDDVFSIYLDTNKKPEGYR